MHIVCIHQSRERTSGAGPLKFGTIEDFPVPDLTGDDNDFGFAFMWVPGKSKPTIVAAFAVKGAVRVIFDKHPGNDTFLIIKAERKESDRGV